MSDTGCEACAAGETWDDKAGEASLEKHHSLIARLRAELAERDALIREVVDWGEHPERAEGNEGEDDAFPAGWWAKARLALADHPDAGVK